jgi:hypothetical protein
MPELRHFAFGFVRSRWRGQGFREGFAVHFIGQPKVRTMARLTRSMATAVWFPAATRGAGNGTSTKITEFHNPLSNGVASLF